MANSVLLAIWGKGSTGALQALHMGWPIGQVLGPLIAIPFVSTPAEDDEDPLNSTSLTTSSYMYSDDYSTIGDRFNSNFTEVDPGAVPAKSYILEDRFRDDSRIEIAFWIVSAYFLLMALLFVIM